MDNKKSLANMANDVDDPAYLLIGNGFVGVNDDLMEIAKFVDEHVKSGETVQIRKGYKKELLGMQQRVLLLDESLKDVKSDTILIPQRQEDYNIVRREGSLLFPIQLVSRSHNG